VDRFTGEKYFIMEMKKKTVKL